MIERKSSLVGMARVSLGLSLLSAGCITTPLMDAAKRGDNKRVVALLDKGADINQTTKYSGGGAIVYAAMAGHLETLQLLLDRGADPKGALNVACVAEKPDVVRLLLSRFPEGQASCLVHPLTADAAKFREIIALVMGAGVEVDSIVSVVSLGDTPSATRITPLGAAVNFYPRVAQDAAFPYMRIESLRTVELLLEAGADFNKKNSDGTTALEMAKKANASEILALFKKAPSLAARRRSWASEMRKYGVSGTAPASLKADSAVKQEGAADAAARRGQQEEALKLYAQAVADAADDRDGQDRIRGKLLKLAGAMAAPPPIPEDAERHMVRGRFLAKQAKSEDDFAAAAAEVEQAVQAAPWWSAAYYNLALLQDSAGQFDEALRNFKLYLASSPEAHEAKEVQHKIYELELKAEQGPVD